jgi:hypothetical protein
MLNCELCFLYFGKVTCMSNPIYIGEDQTAACEWAAGVNPIKNFDVESFFHVITSILM